MAFRNRFVCPSLLFLQLSLLSCLLHAQEREPMLALGVGTNGLQAEYYYPLADKLSLSASLSYFRLPGTFNMTIGDHLLEISPGVNYFQPALMLNFYPFGTNDRKAGWRPRHSYGRSNGWKSGWRLRGGIGYNTRPVYEARTTPAGDVYFGSFQLTDEQKGYVNASISVNSLQPFAGLGYDGRFNDRWGLAVDAGIFYHGKPGVSMTSSGIFMNTEAEAQQLTENLRGYQWYPHLNIKLLYYLNKSEL